MDSLVALIVVGLTVVSYVCGQSAKVEWTALEFYSPQDEPMKCGFPDNYEAYICDPNGILTVPDLKAINWILRDAAHNGTKCPCSTYFCETEKKSKGYTIAVALVKRMKKQSDNGNMLSTEDMAKKFSRELKTMKWKMGQCEEDIIIFYSVDDKMLSIDPGTTAAVKLTPYYIDLLAYKIGGRLNDGHIVEALNVLVYDMKVILNCDLANPYDCTIYEKGAASSIKASFVSLITLITSFGVYFWMQH